MWKYRLGPFLIASEIDIPELNAQPGGEPNVWIRLGRAPERLEGVVANETQWWASQDEYLQRVPGIATFHVSRGREVVVEPAPGALAGDIRAYLLAPIFSQLCYQAGMYALHASSVRAGDGVVAFLGDSGAGKSTLAAFLERRGFPVVSDDMCLLDPAHYGSDETRVVPVAPALKLWRSAVDQLGESPAEMPKVWSREDKYRMRIWELEERLPLREVVYLEWDPDPEAAVIFKPLPAVEAVTRLMQFTHNMYLMRPTGRMEENFRLCGQILSHVRAFVLRRPQNFARIEAVIGTVADHLSELAVE